MSFDSCFKLGVREEEGSQWGLGRAHPALELGCATPVFEHVQDLFLGLRTNPAVPA